LKESYAGLEGFIDIKPCFLLLITGGLVFDGRKQVGIGVITKVWGSRWNLSRGNAAGLIYGSGGR
jgi:hypothetical protein